jgi:hypothetical protein
MLHHRAAALVSALLQLAACTDDESGSDTPAASSSPFSSSWATATATSGRGSGTPSPAAPTDEQRPHDGSFPADTGDAGGPAQPGSNDDPAGRMRVTGLRLNGYEGYARLVVDLNRGGVPEWTVGYSEASDPGGGPVNITGDAFLRLRLRTQAEPGGLSMSQVSARPGPIAGARTTGFSEGYEEVLIGIRGGERPFRAFTLTGPGRIVIDVRSEG